MGTSTDQLDPDREVPEQAFEDHIIDLDFHVNPMEGLW